MKGAPDKEPLGGPAWGPAVCPRAEVTEAIQSRCTRGLTRQNTRSAAQRSLSSIAVAILVVAFFFGAVFFAREGIADARASVLVVGGLLHAAVLFFVLGLRSISGPMVIVRLTLASLVPLSFLMLLAVKADAWRPAAELFADAASRSRTAHCAWQSLLVGSFAFAGMVASWYRTDAFTPGLSGWIAGLAGGIVGSTASASLCSDSSAFHLGTSHGLVVLLLGAIGWAAGRRLLAP